MERAEVREEMRRRMERRVVKEMAGVAVAAVGVVSSEGVNILENLIKGSKFDPKVSSTVCEARRSARIRR